MDKVNDVSVGMCHFSVEKKYIIKTQTNEYNT